MDKNSMYAITFIASLANGYFFCKSYYYYLYFQTHGHYRGIMHHIYLSFLCSTISTFCMALLLMWDEDPKVLEFYFFANKIATLGQNSLSALFLLLLLERFWATLNRMTYERSEHMGLIYFGIFLCWLFGVWNILAWNVWQYGAAFMGRVAYGVDIFTVICTFILWRRNYQLKKIHPNSEIMLTQRYQISENIRTIRFALPFLSIGTFALLFGGLLSEYFGPTDHRAPMFYFCYINIFFPFMVGYDKLHKWFIKYSGFTKKRLQKLSKFRAARVTPVTDSFNIIEDNIDRHFQQLQISWNKDP